MTIDHSYLQNTYGLSGKTALITGGARGIGKAAALAMGRAGARIVINDLDGAACEEAISEFASADIEARASIFNVADKSAVDEAAGQLARDDWNVDILFSNAGNQNRKPFVEMTSEEWQGLLSVHVNGAFHCARAFLPAMLNRKYGRIILTSSVAGQASMPLIAAYATAKGGIASLARALAVEYGGQGITSNAIAPGFVRTGFTTGLQERPGFEEFLAQTVPAGRWATPEDIASVVLFLASSASGFVNGQTLAIDGGMLARM